MLHSLSNINLLLTRDYLMKSCNQLYPLSRDDDPFDFSTDSDPAQFLKTPDSDPTAKYLYLPFCSLER